MSEHDPEDEGRARAPGQATTFEDIIANERAAGWDPKVPDAGLDTDPAAPPAARPPTSPSAAPPTARPTSPTSANPPEEDEHYVPPEPPPMPRLGMAAAVGLTLLSFGIVLLAVPGVFGVNYGIGVPLGLLALALGLGWLIHNAVRASYPHDGDDGSAV